MILAGGWLPWALLSALFAAATAIFAKLGLEGVDSDYATFIRTLLIAVVLALLLSALGKWRDPFVLSGRTWRFLALSAFATGASWLCYFRALKAGPASSVAPVDKLSVVLVAVFAVVFLGARPGAREWAGIGMIAVGAILLAFKR